eukprot:1154169-Pelagomonas_calceolata.AAC.4
MHVTTAVSSEYNGACCASFASLPALAGSAPTPTELSPGGRPTLFCFAGCPFLDAWALASLPWFAKSCRGGKITA